MKTALAQLDHNTLMTTEGSTGSGQLSARSDTSDHAHQELHDTHSESEVGQLAQSGGKAVVFHVPAWQLKVRLATAASSDLSESWTDGKGLEIERNVLSGQEYQILIRVSRQKAQPGTIVVAYVDEGGYAHPYIWLMRAAASDDYVEGSLIFAPEVGSTFELAVVEVGVGIDFLHEEDASAVEASLIHADGPAREQWKATARPLPEANFIRKAVIAVNLGE